MRPELKMRPDSKERRPADMWDSFLHTAEVEGV